LNCWGGSSVLREWAHFCHVATITILGTPFFILVA